jgi:hypothetical protein
MNSTKYFSDKIISVVQELEEIGGPDTLDEYIATLTIVKLELEKRIKVASDRVSDGEE